MSFPILKKLKALDINAELNIVLKSLESQILALNTDDQLFSKGITIEGIKIEPPYTSNTKSRKKRKGQPTNRVTTRDTGRYHSDFRIKYDNIEFTILVGHENADLAASLELKYGHLEGLTEESIGKLIKMIHQPLIDAIKQKLN